MGAIQFAHPFHQAAQLIAAERSGNHLTTFVEGTGLRPELPLSALATPERRHLCRSFGWVLKSQPCGQVLNEIAIASRSWV